jgi:hypothetical protein
MQRNNEIVSFHFAELRSEDEESLRINDSKGCTRGVDRFSNGYESTSTYSIKMQMWSSMASLVDYALALVRRCD